MSFGNTAETEILTYIYLGTDVSWDGNANLWFSAHTADPGEAGTAVTSEAAYGSYARVQTVRATGLSISGDTVRNAALVQFPISTVAGENITHLALVTSASGAGTIIGRYTLTSALPTAIGVQPQFPANTIAFTLT